LELNHQKSFLKYDSYEPLKHNDHLLHIILTKIIE